MEAITTCKWCNERIRIATHSEWFYGIQHNWRHFENESVKCQSIEDEQIHFAEPRL